jgi:hypothetical protein
MTPKPAHTSEPVVTPVFAKKTRATPTADRSDEMFADWKRGVPIHQLVIDYAPTSRSSVRKALTKASGSVEQFRALREQGAGGRAAEPSTSVTRATRTPRRDATPAPRIDDSHVPMTLSAKSSDGWKHRRLRGDVMIFIAPDGTEYVHAADTQPADLIHIGVPEGIPPVRLRRYAASGKAHRDAQAKADEAQLATQQKAQRDIKRAKRRTKLEKRATKTGR